MANGGSLGHGEDLYEGRTCRGGGPRGRLGRAGGGGLSRAVGRELKELAHVAWVNPARCHPGRPKRIDRGWPCHRWGHRRVHNAGRDRVVINRGVGNVTPPQLDAATGIHDNLSVDLTVIRPKCDPLPRYDKRLLGTGDVTREDATARASISSITVHHRDARMICILKVNVGAIDTKSPIKVWNIVTIDVDQAIGADTNGGDGVGTEPVELKWQGDIQEAIIDVVQGHQKSCVAETRDRAER